MQIFSVYVDKLRNRLDPLFYSQSSVNFYKRAKFKLEKLNNLAIYLKSGFAAGKQDQDHINKPIIQIRPTNINEDGFLYFDKNIYLKKKIAGKKQSELLKRGEVLFNNTNSQELVGKTAFFDLEGNYLCSNHITRVMVDENKILSRYLWLVLNIYQHNKVFFNICTNWNNQSGVNIDLLKTLDIPVPDIETQKQIVEIIITAYQQKQKKEKEAQELFDSIDEYVLRELGITIPAVKNEITFTVYSNDIKDKRIDPYYYQNSFITLSNLLTDIKTYKLKDLITDLTGGATPKVTENFYLENNGIPFLRVQNITKQGINLEDVKYIKPEIHENLLKRSQLKKDDIVFTITGRIGNAAVVPEKFTGNINQHSIRFHLKNSINDVLILPEYIAIFFNTNLGTMLSLRNITGGTRPALDYEAIKNLIIPLPPIDFQKKIIHEVHTQKKQSRNLRIEALEDLKKAKKQVEEMMLSSN